MKKIAFLNRSLARNIKKCTAQNLKMLAFAKALKLLFLMREGQVDFEFYVPASMNLFVRLLVIPYSSSIFILYGKVIPYFSSSMESLKRKEKLLNRATSLTHVLSISAFS